MNKAGKFFRLPSHERRLFLEAVFWCGTVRLIMLVLPFKKYVWLLGTPHNDTPRPFGAPLSREDRHAAEPYCAALGKAVQQASRNVPWRTRCFVEAIAAKRMLKRRGIPCTIYLGVKKEQSDMSAHAWATSDDIIVTGGPAKNVEGFTVISTFQ